MTTEPRIALAGHTYDRRCPACPGEHGGPGRCDQVRYSRREVAFILAHREEYLTLQLAVGGSARALKERLDREYRTLPSRHVCSCKEDHCASCAVLSVVCVRCRAVPLHSRARDCESCARLRVQDVGLEIGRTSPVHAPSPSAEFLDLLIATAAMRTNRWRDQRQVFEFLNGRVAA